MNNEPHALRGHGREALAVNRAEDPALVDGLPLAVGLPDLQFERLALASAVAGVFDREFKAVKGHRLAEVEYRASLPSGKGGGGGSSERERFQRLVVFHFQDAVGEPF